MSVPSSIDDFCYMNGLSHYIPIMHENEIDLDILRDLSREDWKSMGVSSADIEVIMNSAKKLPPGSYRTWGKGVTIAQAVKDAMLSGNQEKRASKNTAPQEDLAPIVRFGKSNQKPNAKKEADKKDETPVVKPKLHVDLLEEMAVGKVQKPSTEMGTKMERAKDLMERANAFMTGNHCERAAETLFKSCNDLSRAFEASTKRQQAIFQAQMQIKSKEQNTQKARLSVNQAIKCMKEKKFEAAIGHLEIAESIFLESEEEEALSEIRKLKEEASLMNIESKSQQQHKSRSESEVILPFFSLVASERCNQDASQEWQMKIKEQEFRIKAIQSEAKKHEEVARALQGNLNIDEEQLQSASERKTNPTEGLVLDSERRRAEIDMMKEARRREAESKMASMRQVEEIHRKLYVQTVQTQLAQAVGQDMLRPREIDLNNDEEKEDVLMAHTYAKERPVHPVNLDPGPIAPESTGDATLQADNPSSQSGNEISNFDSTETQDGQGYEYFHAFNHTSHNRLDVTKSPEHSSVLQRQNAEEILPVNRDLLGPHFIPASIPQQEAKRASTKSGNTVHEH
eukprot:768769-Hanusia_phi.AAC.3